MIEELVARLFATRNAAHPQHCATRSYAEHVALGDFYDQVIDAIYDFVEARQGAFGLIGDVDVEAIEKNNIAEHIRQEARWVGQNADQITGKVRGLQNLVDAITDVYMKTYYKLTNLS